jgi:hypothetical protein
VQAEARDKSQWRDKNTREVSGGREHRERERETEREREREREREGGRERETILAKNQRSMPEA